MTRACARIAASATLGAALAAAAAAQTPAATSPPQAPGLPRCTQADAKIVSRVDSAFATAGDAFVFKIAQTLPSKGNVPEIPLGTRGYGVVAYAEHASGSGAPGRLVVEPRFLQLADGTHVPVMADPQLSDGIVAGRTRNLAGAFAFVPGFGLAVGGYNALHRGKEVVIEKNTPFRVVIGDDLALSQCFVPPPSAPDVR